MKRRDMLVKSWILGAALTAGAGFARADGSVPAAATEPADALPAGQVWECKAHGQHVFSDKPCGADASIRQLRALNTMEAPAQPRASGNGGPPRASYPMGSYSAQDVAADSLGDGSQPYADESDEAAGALTPLVYYGGIARPQRVRYRPQHRPVPHAPQAAPPARKVTASRAAPRIAGR
jgi:hypothetical protein